MNTDTIRLNITLPKDLVTVLDELAGPRKRSHFIAEALRQQIERKEQEKMEVMLAEGYRVRKDENSKVAEAFESADLEGWDEY